MIGTNINDDLFRSGILKTEDLIEVCSAAREQAVFMLGVLSFRVLLSRLLIATSISTLWLSYYA
jgi:hypothetical protein